MTTSGTITFSLNAREVITFALKKLRVIAGNEEPQPADAEDAMDELNAMLKEWQKYESLWRFTEVTLTPTASTAAITFSPVPHRVISVRYYDGTNEMPLQLLSREEYYDLPLKVSDGVPTCYYVDYQRAATTLYIWQTIATVSTKRIKATYQRKFEDISSLDNDIDVRQEHLSVVGYNLAERLGIDHGRVGLAGYAKIEAKAQQLLEEALDEDREDEIRFVPDYAY